MYMFHLPMSTTLDPCTIAL